MRRETPPGGFPGPPGTEQPATRFTVLGSMFSAMHEKGTCGPMRGEPRPDAGSAGFSIDVRRSLSDQWAFAMEVLHEKPDTPGTTTPAVAAGTRKHHRPSLIELPRPG